MERNPSLNLDSIGNEQGRLLLNFLEKTVKQDATYGIPYALINSAMAASGCQVNDTETFTLLSQCVQALLSNCTRSLKEMKERLNANDPITTSETSKYCMVSLIIDPGIGNMTLRLQQIIPLQPFLINVYDTDVTTWSPQGRLHQTEYAMEGVKLGTCAVGVRSDTHVVITGLKRSFSKLASYNCKISRVDSHIGLTFSGITADARYLTNVLRKECLTHRFIYDSPHPIESLVAHIGSKSQTNTQRYSKRPYGCGLIIGGVDSSGPHLFETCPSGNFTEYYAIAFGSRCQAAKTYLENHFQEFPSLPVDQLIHHALRALQTSASQDQELSLDNVSVGVVSKDVPWKELTPLELKSYLDDLPVIETPAVDDTLLST